MENELGPWKAAAPFPVMYVEGEMSYHDNRERIFGFGWASPENLSIINHEVLFQATSKTMNFADRHSGRICSDWPWLNPSF